MDLYTYRYKYTCKYVNHMYINILGICGYNKTGNSTRFEDPEENMNISTVVLFSVELF